VEKNKSLVIRDFTVAIEEVCMKSLIGRMAGAIVLGGAAVAFVTPAASWADPPGNCQPGQYWDGYSNACRPVGQGPALNCPPGQWWDPNGNVCRDLGHTAAG
jgi:hypothetical protein